MGKIVSDVYGISRLKEKNSEQAIIQTIAKNFNLVPKVAEAYYSEMKQYFKSHTVDNAQGGDILYEAISSEEPLGKPIKECKRKLIKLKFQVAADFKNLKEEGLPELRKTKLKRFCDATIAQGAVLTYEDLAHLLTTSVSTIKTDARKLREEKILLATRGREKDIGRTVSHKFQIIKLWLKKYTFSEIESSSRHSADSIERYIEEFKRTIYLKEKGLEVQQIRLITKRSEKLIQEYIDIYEEALKNPKKYLNLPVLAEWAKKGAKDAGIKEQTRKGVMEQ